MTYFQKPIMTGFFGEPVMSLLGKIGERIRTLRPAREDVEEFRNVLLQKPYGTLVNVKDMHLVLIENSEPHLEVVKFDDFLDYAYKRVVANGVERVIDRNVWEQLFRQKAPDHIYAISTASVFGKPVENLERIISDGVVFLRIESIPFDPKMRSELLNRLTMFPSPFSEKDPNPLLPQNHSNNNLQTH